MIGKHAASEFTLQDDARIIDVARVIDRNGLKIAVLVDREQRLTGVATDGDLRRAIMQGAETSDRALPYTTRNPTVVRVGTPHAHALDLMKARSIGQIPIVDANRRVVGLETLAEIVGRGVLPNVAVIMAGGRGERLGEITSSLPKPLVPVAGRPIIEWVILNLIGGGIHRFVITTNYLGDLIAEKLGDGSSFGAAIDYVREEHSKPLGTAGGLALLDRELLGSGTIVVTNADLIAHFDVGDLIDQHALDGNAITICTRLYQHQVPFGVVEESHDGLVCRIAEKPTFNFCINAGVYALEQDVIDLIPTNLPLDMPALVGKCITLGYKVGRWSVTSDWIDVGTPRDLDRARGVL